MRSLTVLATLAAFSLPMQAQDSSANTVRLDQELQQTRSQLKDAVQEIEALRRDLQELRTEMRSQAAANAAAAQPQPVAQTTTVGEAQEPTPVTVEAADKDPAFLAAKISEMHQVKVESGSRYPLKLSGIVLLNAYGNSGSPDIDDLPNLAFGHAPGASNGSVGATLRQTVLNLDAHGPEIFGATTSGDVSVDFFGGSPETSYGITAGLIRLRTANLHLAWKDTTLNIGQDSPFFSPLNPTSYATLAEPGLSWSGNLWVWTPQVMLEHRITTGEQAHLVLQGGILDPLTEEEPDFEGRVATAGEQTRLPAIAGRVAYDRSSASRMPFTIGLGAYRAQQRYVQARHIDSWTMNIDWKIGITRFAEVSGEWYRGQAAGGLGGGIWQSVIYSGDFSQLAGVHSSGGWAQLKIKPATRFEVNTAYGQDGIRGSDLRMFTPPVNVYGFPPLQKNRTVFSNVVFKPNSVLLLALEYRHLFTAPAFSPGAHLDHVNVSAGLRF